MVVGISIEADSPQLDAFVARQQMDYTVAVSEPCGSRALRPLHIYIHVAPCFEGMHSLIVFTMPCLKQCCCHGFMPHAETCRSRDLVWDLERLVSAATADRCRVGGALMSAANVSGIPHSFVVDSAGIVKFQGHPADPNFEKAVAQVGCGPR